MADILSILGKIGFDWQVALANLFNFLIILFILKKFAFKPVKKIIDERQAKIKEGLENAKRAKTELMMAGQKGEELVRVAKDEAMKIMAESAQAKEDAVKRAKLKAREDARHILLEAKKAGDDELEKMKRKFREESVDLIIASAQKVLKRSISETEDKKYIKDMMPHEI